MESAEPKASVESACVVLLMDVIKHVETPGKILEEIVNALGESVQKRRSLSLDGPVYLVSDSSPYFGLMSEMGLIDFSKGSISQRGANLSQLSCDYCPRSWHISDKAIELHAQLAQEGYYGGKDN